MKNIIRTPVVSSQIESIGYDPTTLEMDVCFKAFTKAGTPPKPNVTYRYQHITPELHNAIVTAESIGREMNQRVKKLPGSFPYRKLSAEEAAQE